MGEVAYLYLCIPGRMIYPELPEIDEELIKLKHFEAVHDLCSLVGAYPLRRIEALLRGDEALRLRDRGELIVKDALRFKELLNGEPLVKGLYVILRLRRSFQPGSEP